MITDTELFGLTTAQQMSIDRENFEVAHRPSRKDANSGPFHLNCLLDAIEDVARGLRPEPVALFLWSYHVVKVGEQEWRLDWALPLWRKAKAYARQLVDEGLLIDSPVQGGFAFERPEAVIKENEL